MRFYSSCRNNKLILTTHQVTTQKNAKEKKSKLWKIAFITLGILASIAAVSDIMETDGDDSLMGTFLFPLMPGIVVYILVTGDIHGWQPGPIGQVGRILVMVLGSWIFWTPLVYWIYIKLTGR
jgi:hypothetical protein